MRTGGEGRGVTLAKVVVLDETFGALDPDTLEVLPLTLHAGAFGAVQNGGASGLVALERAIERSPNESGVAPGAPVEPPRPGVSAPIAVAGSTPGERSSTLQATSTAHDDTQINATSSVWSRLLRERWESGALGRGCALAMADGIERDHAATWAAYLNC